MDRQAIKTRLEKINLEINHACQLANRSPGEVRLIGICKYQPVWKISAARDFGLKDFGQNYVQGLQKQAELLGEEFNQLNWHFVGNLQTNKVKAILKLFPKNPPKIHTLDRLDLAKALHQRALHPIDCLIQVLPESIPGGIKFEGQQRFGCPKEKVIPLLKGIIDLEKINVSGLMLLPPQEEDLSLTQIHFKNIRKFFQELQKEISNLSCKRIQMRDLSMGMTEDLIPAIKEGATLVRIGTGVFGPREK